ncbi:MAG: hypothetical protein IJO81_02015 [Clostridia bacterium]|nr:hypothetical protein [Clostridia bacterium]
MNETIENVSSVGYLTSRLEDVCDSVKLEKNGNIIGLVKGERDSSPLLIATHRDVPHFICTAVEGEKVFLVHVGNFKCDKWENCDIVSENGVKATIGDSEDKLYGTLKDNEAKVSVGELFFPDARLAYENGIFTVYGISAYAPAAALLLAAQKMSAHRPTRDVYFAFTAEGQYSYKLYADAAKKCGVSEAVCIGSVDSKESETVAVRLCDRSFSSDKVLSDMLISHGATPIAIREGRCAAGTVQVWGIPTAELDVPVREAGSLNESVKECDICAMADIIANFCNSSN